MEILETKRGKSGVQSIVVRCGEYTAELTFCENALHWLIEYRQKGR